MNKIGLVLAIELALAACDPIRVAESSEKIFKTSGDQIILQAVQPTPAEEPKNPRA